MKGNVILEEVGVRVTEERRDERIKSKKEGKAKEREFKSKER